MKALRLLLNVKKHQKFLKVVKLSYSYEANGRLNFSNYQILSYNAIKKHYISPKKLNTNEKDK